MEIHHQLNQNLERRILLLSPMEQDHYKTLGLNRSATKEEVKSAFRKSALEFHPDRHAQSSAATRDAAAAQFKKASEAYETLIDQRRRADYDFRWRNSSSNWNSSSGSGNYHYYRRNSGYGGGGGGGGTTGGYYRAGTSGRSNGFDWRFLSRIITTHGFLLGVGFVSILVGSTLVIEDVIQGAWRRNNSGMMDPGVNGQITISQLFFEKQPLSVT